MVKIITYTKTSNRR